MRAPILTERLFSTQLKIQQSAQEADRKMGGRIEAKIQKLGYAIPEAPAPAGSYGPVTRFGNLVVTSGQVSFVDGKLTHPGKVGAEVSEEEAYNDARICALNALAQLKACVGDLDEIKRVVRVEGYVHSAAGFQRQANVMNGVSELYNELWGDREKHTRIAIGIHEMPLNAAVQISVWAEV